MWRLYVFPPQLRVTAATPPHRRFPKKHPEGCLTPCAFSEQIREQLLSTVVPIIGRHDQGVVLEALGLSLAWAVGKPGVRMLHVCLLTPDGPNPARLCSLILFG